MPNWLKAQFLLMITNFLRSFIRKKHSSDLPSKSSYPADMSTTAIKFHPGDVIIEDIPYAASVSSDSLSYVCSMCFAPTASEPCDSCHKVVYCNDHCKEADYNDHFYECSILLGEEDTVPDEELRVVIRTLTRYLAERNNPSVGYFFGRKRTIDDLLSHVQDLNEEELSSINSRVDEVMTLIEDHMDVDFELALEMLMKCRINSYCIMDHNDPNFYSRGRALYLAASAVDHTCEDTDEYAYMFDGRRFILRSMADFTLKDPRQLRVQYMPTTLPYEKRRKLTLSNYFFLCSCKRCVTDARQPAEERQQRECSDELAAEIDNLFTEQRTMQEWYDGGSEVLKKFGDVPVTDFYHFWVLTRMQVATHEMGLLEESLCLGARGLQGADSVLSMEPIMFYMCSAMARLGWNKSNSKSHDAFHKGYKLAKKLFSVTHGKDHSIMKILATFKRPVSASELVAAEG